jgi:hypothetical protein
MTARETIEIISSSSLWHTLSAGERLEAAQYAMKITGIMIENEEVCSLLS